MLKNTIVFAPFLVVISAFFITSSLCADTIELVRGNRLEGKIIKETDDEVGIRTAEGDMFFPRRLVTSIVRDDSSPGPARPKPAPAEPEPAEPEPAEPEPAEPEPAGPEPAEPETADRPAGRSSVEWKAEVKGGTPDLGAIPQSPLVTLDLTDRPVSEALYRISRLTGQEVKWDSFDAAPRISIRLDKAPLWEAVLAVCMKGDWGFTQYSQPGYPICLPGGSFGRGPVRAYQVNGPAALIWRGITSESKNEDGGTEKPGGRELQFKIDRHSDVTIPDPVMNPEFLFSFKSASGRPVRIKADSEMQDGMGGRAWQFNHPRNDFHGHKADLEVTLQVWAPTYGEETAVPWESGRNAQSNGLTVSLDNVIQGKDALTATVSLAWDKEVFRADREKLNKMRREIADSGRGETGEDKARFQVLQGGGRAMGLRQVELVGTDGKRTKGLIGGGGGDPWTGYAWSLEFESEKGFTPRELSVSWSSGFRPVDLKFELKDIPLE